MRHTNYFSLGNCLYDFDYYTPKKKEERGHRRTPSSNPKRTNAETRGTTHFDWITHYPVAHSSNDLNQ